MIKKSVDELKKWMYSKRFQNIKRPYDSKIIYKAQPDLQTNYISNKLAGKLYQCLNQHHKNKTASYTFGILDPIQAVQTSPYVDTFYVSGWQCASTATSSNEVGPDFSDYPYDTVPRKVQQLSKALEFHQCKQKLLNDQSVDYYKPIIADADTGHGGITSVLKITKMFIEMGTSGIHLEDQKHGSKRCGHLGGKVLVSTQEHIDRLVAARFQADLMLNPLVVIARTDAESAKYLDNNIDKKDHRFIIGELKTEYGIERCTFLEAIEKLYKYENKPFNLTLYLNCTKDEALIRAREHIELPFTYDWEKCRTAEGFYLVKSGLEYSINRGLAYANYADLLWMETSTPNYEQAKQFSIAIKSKYPNMMLAYNLSPSFNWDSNGMSNPQIKEFIHELAKLGYCWQFITLAGFHVNGLATTNFARNYQTDGMLAYVNNIQRQEKIQKVEVLKHQQWSGIDLMDYYLSIITNNKSSTLASSEGCTETQFK